MGRGSYFGGSTLIGPGSGWLSKGPPKKQLPKTPSATSAKKKRKVNPPNPKKAARKAALLEKRNAALAKQKALRAVSPPTRAPEEVLKRLGRHMEGVEVFVRHAGGALTVVKQNRTGTTAQARRAADRRTLSLKASKNLK